MNKIVVKRVTITWRNSRLKEEDRWSPVSETMAEGERLSALIDA